jgi:hypothetical protein
LEKTTLHSGYHFIEQGEYSGVTPHVIDVDQRGASIQRPHSADCKIVSPIKDKLRQSVHQGHNASLPCDLHRQGIHVSCELATAPVPLIFYKSPSLFDDLSLEWLRHNRALFL